MTTRLGNALTRNDAHLMQAARHPLAALMDRVRELNGWSDPHVVERARKEGFDLSKSNISRVRNQPVVSLTRSTIEGLAAGLGIPASEIARAALDSMGIELADAGSLDLETVIRMDTSLSLANKQMLLGMVRQMRALDTRRTSDESTSTQTSPPRNPEAGSSTRIGASIDAPTEDDENNVHALNRRKQGSTPAPDFANPGELAAARKEPGYIKSGKRDQGFDEDHPSK